MRINKEIRAQHAGTVIQTRSVRNLEWWESVPAFERDLIRTFMKMVKGAKRSQSRNVAVAAGEWERDFRAFITLRLKNRLYCRRERGRNRKIVNARAAGTNPKNN